MIAPKSKAKAEQLILADEAEPKASRATRPASRSAFDLSTMFDALAAEVSGRLELDELSELAEVVGRLSARVDELESRPARRIEVHQPALPAVTIEDAPPAFDDVLALAGARKNIFLHGPAGSGKTTLAAKVAEAIGLRFGAISCSMGMSEAQLTGRLLPVGAGGAFEFVSTEFLDCYENGGVFLFDELDSADANVLIVLNTALANNYLSLPNRPALPYAYRHPDFICVAAANTTGRGADRCYVGRAQLDEATLDRFRIGMVEVDYWRELEEQLCPDEELRETLWRYREAVLANKLPHVVSTRFLRDAAEMKSLGWSMERIEKALFAGWSADAVRRVKG